MNRAWKIFQAEHACLPKLQGVTLIQVGGD